MDDISHRPRVTAIMTEYAPHLIKVVSHATYMRENKIAMEGRKVDLIAIYSNLPRDKINKDDKFLKDILIEYFSPDEANDWLQRPRVYGLKGLTGNDLDLQKRCVKINGKANTLLLKLKSEIFPPKKVTIDETDADADVGMDADSGKSDDQSAKLEKILFEKEKKIKQLESKVIDLTTDHEIREPCLQFLYGVYLECKKGGIHDFENDNCPPYLQNLEMKRKRGSEITVQSTKKKALENPTIISPSKRMTPPPPPARTDLSTAKETNPPPPARTDLSTAKETTSIPVDEKNDVESEEENDVEGEEENDVECEEENYVEEENDVEYEEEIEYEIEEEEEYQY